ncbi:MAG: hypothetical protein E6K82_06235 [Candidatus Rokuibacteriota bacterium]|nr:MAG: hypothetical protein E6K82_06235 [Candidatus Rokubacteria bacterium]
MSDRRYRQSGYRSEPGPRQEPREPPRPPSGTFGILKSKPTSRCAECGAVLPITADSLAQCPGCRAELHACRQCAHFDPARRFECAQPIVERIADKRAKNACTAFALMVTVERDTSSGAVRPDDARRAFGNLFKK